MLMSNLRINLLETVQVALWCPLLHISRFLQDGYLFTPSLHASDRRYGTDPIH